jgi:hypothetical protein
LTPELTSCVLKNLRNPLDSEISFLLVNVVSVLGIL